MKRLLLLSAAMLLGGCAGAEGTLELAHEEILQQVVPGETTKPTVVELLGEPETINHSQDADSKKEVWRYHLLTRHTSTFGYIPILNLLPLLFMNPSLNHDEIHYWVNVDFADSSTVQSLSREGFPIQARSMEHVQYYLEHDSRVLDERAESSQARMRERMSDN